MARDATEPVVNIARQARYGDRDGPRSTEPPIPVDLDASAAAWAAAHVVVTWMDHIARTRGVRCRRGSPARRAAVRRCRVGRCAGPVRSPSCDAIRHDRPEHPVAAAARFVAAHLGWLRRTPDATAAG
ncbi:hypothetical protein, partial [Micromonospora inyonensis]